MSQTTASQPPITAALVSVGGAPAPILHVLRKHQPKHVWYFCSAGSRGNADAIQAQLDWHPAPRFIEVERFEELIPCYQELRRAIRAILEETKVPPAAVLVDYTGGTKTMSAALVLAAVELFDRFSYIGGEQRDKDGLGVVVGQVHVVSQNNPWRELAVREVRRACDLRARCDFDAAARALQAAAPEALHPLRLRAFATLAQGMAARHRLDFPEAQRRLQEAIGRLRPIFEGHADGPLKLAQEALAICDACAAATVNDTFLRELLDNALRTAAQGRYEDAAARLYRAMEMQGQIWLADATGGAFLTGRCKPQNASALPEALRPLPFCQPDEHGEIRLSLEQCFRALAALGQERARAIVTDLDGRDASGQPQSRWRAATEKRNTSILAHGVQPIGKDGFEQMKQIAAAFLGFDLTREHHPIPPLEPRWFEPT
jgi:CRISPR-associated protein (TIGR02710 family)